MNPITLLAPILAVALVAGFAFIADASIIAKVAVAALLLLSFFIGGQSMIWALAGTLLQVALCIGLIVYFKVAR